MVELKGTKMGLHLASEWSPVGHAGMCYEESMKMLGQPDCRKGG